MEHFDGAPVEIHPKRDHSAEPSRDCVDGVNRPVAVNAIFFKIFIILNLNIYLYISIHLYCFKNIFQYPACHHRLQRV